MSNIPLDPSIVEKALIPIYFKGRCCCINAKAEVPSHHFLGLANYICMNYELLQFNHLGTLLRLTYAIESLANGKAGQIYEKTLYYQLT